MNPTKASNFDICEKQENYNFQSRIKSSNIKLQIEDPPLMKQIKESREKTDKNHVEDQHHDVSDGFPCIAIGT